MGEIYSSNTSIEPAVKSWVWTRSSSWRYHLTLAFLRRAARWRNNGIQYLDEEWVCFYLSSGAHETDSSWSTVLNLWSFPSSNLFSFNLKLWSGSLCPLWSGLIWALEIQLHANKGCVLTFDAGIIPAQSSTCRAHNLNQTADTQPWKCIALYSKKFEVQTN